MACIVFKQGKYWLYHHSDFDHENMVNKPLEQIWLSMKKPNKNLFGHSNIIKEANNQTVHPEHGYRLKLGDILRFGRVRFYVKAISSDLSHSVDEVNGVIEKHITEQNGTSTIRDSIQVDEYYGENSLDSPDRSQNNNQNSLNTITFGDNYVNDLRNSFSSIQNNLDESETVIKNLIKQDLSFSQIKIPQTNAFQTDLNKNKENVCRICLEASPEGEEMTSNPLIAPCK